MKNPGFGLFVVVGLVLALVAPAAAQAPAPPTPISEQMWHFGKPPASSPAPAPGAPLLGWAQSNASGFGVPNNYAVSSLQAFGGQLYAGTTNDSGGQIWRTADGVTWNPASGSGFGIPTPMSNSIIYDMITFNGMLYAGAGHWFGPGVAGQIWRSANGGTWERVTGGWELNPNNMGVVNFAAFGARLYAATFNPVDGTEIWRSATGNSNDWERVAASGFGGGASFWQVTGLIVSNAYLYAAVEEQAVGTGAQIWRTADGSVWSPVMTNGFGNPANYQVGGWAVFNGYLYVGTLNDATGGQLWRSPDGVSWSPLVGNGFGDINNYKIEGLVFANGVLFAFTDNKVTGTEVWRSTNGVNWSQDNPDGFGTNTNVAVALWSNGAALFNGRLYLGTWRAGVGADGGQVWATDNIPQLLIKTYLPFAAR